MLPCFDGSATGPGCNSCNQYAKGSWVAVDTPPAYQLPSAMIRDRAGIMIDNSSTHHYGRCAERHQKRHGTTPQQYEWRPANCALQPFEAERACDTLRAVGKSFLLVGDSTTGQVFLSLVSLLGGRMGRNQFLKRILNDVTASACGDTVRLSFVRSDVLLFSRHMHEFRVLRGCHHRHNNLVAGSFQQRAAMADVVLLSTGHHYPVFFETVVRGVARDAFFTRNLNHTLLSVARLRAERGHAAASLVVLGATLPVPHCTLYHEPIPLGEYLAADAAALPTPRWAGSWRQISRINWVAKALTEAAGGSFLAVDEISARRPDAAMAHIWSEASSRRAASGRAGRASTALNEAVEDCLHYCQPGPPDTWSNLLLNLLASWREGGNGSAASVGDGARGGGGGGGRRLGRRGRAPFRAEVEGGRGSGFFSISSTEWLKTRGAAAHLEHGAGCSPSCVPDQALLIDQWWWPFGNCTKGKAEML